MLKVGVNEGAPTDLSAYRKDVAKRLVNAAARAASRAAIETRDDIRSAMTRQRLGKLSRIVGATSDLSQRRVPSGDGGFDVAGVVFARPRSPRTVGAFEAYVSNSTTSIVPKGGKYLAVASDQIPSRVGKRRMTPDLYRSSGLEERIGPLTFVKGRHPGVAFLIVKEVQVTPGKKRSAKRLTKRGNARVGNAKVGIIAFTLIRATRRSRRVDPHAIAARHAQQLPSLLTQELAAGGRASS